MEGHTKLSDLQPTLCVSLWDTGMETFYHENGNAHWSMFPHDRYYNWKSRIRPPWQAVNTDLHSVSTGGHSDPETSLATRPHKLDGPCACTCT